MTYTDKRDAIVAALDELEPGATLTVHEEDCGLAYIEMCTCFPEKWTYLE